MENPKILEALDEFAKAKPKDIPHELEDYLRLTASSGDHVYQWSLVKCLFRQKLVNVISEFYESCPMMDVPISPNVDAFNYEIFKSRLLQRFDKFAGAPFTIQRIAELLAEPRKQYNRVDKFMRAIEKNIWVVSTREPGHRDIVVPETTINVNGVPESDAKPQTSVPERLKRQNELFDDEEEESDGESSIPINAEIPTILAETASISSTSTTAAVGEQSNSYFAESDPVQDEDKLDVKVTDTETERDTTSTETAQDTETANDENESEAEEESIPVVPVEELAEVEVHKEDVLDEASEESTDVLVTDCNNDEVTEDAVATTVGVEEPEEKPEPESNRSDLKRKLEVDEDEDEKDVPCKKLGVEESVTPPSEIVDATSVVEDEKLEKDKEDIPSENIDQVTEVALIEKDEEVSEPAIVVEAIAEEQNPVEEVQEPVEGIVHVEELIEKDMESVECEEKVEMVIEEPEQAMEVDETSVQSPMECAVAEPMEESDIGLS